MKKLLALVPLLLLIAGCSALRGTQEVYTEVPPGSGNIVTNIAPVYGVDPRLETGIGAARVANQTTAPFNPWAGLIDYALGGALLVAAEIARRKTAQAAINAKLLTTVIQGVENAGESAAPVKASIRTLATAKEVEGQLGAIVGKITE